jgi:hypothetical protein
VLACSRLDCGSYTSGQSFRRQELAGAAPTGWSLPAHMYRLRLAPCLLLPARAHRDLVHAAALVVLQPDVVVAADVEPERGEE